MSRVPELKQARNKKIVSEYKTLSEKKIGNQQLYKHGAILEMLSKKYFLAQLTIQEIVSGNA